MRMLLLGLLGLVAVVFLATWLRDLFIPRPTPHAPGPFECVVGFVTNFFDTLGIGSFAPTTALFRFRRVVNDEDLPGTMNVGDSPPVILQAFIFVTAVAVEPVTLLVLIGAATLGSWLGAGVVTHWSRDRIRIGMGLGLLFAASILVLRNLDGLRATPMFPGGDAIGLTTPWLVLAAGLMFVMGALVTLGIGLYAPCLIMVSLLGMNPRAAFPIMMGACAFVMPLASLRFIKAKRYAMGPAIALAVGGLPGVAVAAFVVKALPLEAVRWLVVAVVLYTATTMLRTSSAASPSSDTAYGS